MYNSNLCSAITRSGQECMSEVPEGAPFSLCLKHIIKIGRFWDQNKAAIIGAGIKHGEEVLGRKSVGHENKHPNHYVYYISHGNRIKIGTSTNWRKRMTQLPHDSLIGLEYGDMSLEFRRHKQFAHLRVRDTEWFESDRELWDHVFQVNDDNEDLTREVNEYNSSRRSRRPGRHWNVPNTRITANSFQ